MRSNESMVYSDLDYLEKLNFYRNRYYTDGNNTEKGEIANALNEFLPKFHTFFKASRIIDLMKKMFVEKYNIRLESPAEVKYIENSNTLDLYSIKFSCDDFELIVYETYAILYKNGSCDVVLQYCNFDDLLNLN